MQFRKLWLTGLIRGIPIAPLRTQGYERVRSELTIGMEIEHPARLGSGADDEMRLLVFQVRHMRRLKGMGLMQV